MEIIRDDRETGFITARIEGRMVQAKVFDNPSRFGIDDGRISILHVSKADHERMVGISDACYNYSRGLDFDHGDPVVPAIIRQLEALPPTRERRQNAAAGEVKP